MATITTSLTPNPISVGYIGPAPNIVLSQTPIPRGEVIFREISTAVTISGVGDDQRIEIICNLPAGFCYVLAEMYMTIVNVDVDAWDTGCQVRVQDSVGSPRWRAGLRFEGTTAVQRATAAILLRQYNLVRPSLQKVIICDRGDNGELLLRVMNVTTNQAAGTVEFLARFFQYELAQGFYWGTNTSFPTRG